MLLIEYENEIIILCLKSLQALCRSLTCVFRNCKFFLLQIVQWAFTKLLVGNDFVGRVNLTIIFSEGQS